MSDIFNKKRVVSYSHGKKRKEEYRAYSLSCSLSCEGTARQTSASWKRALTGSCINQHLDLGPPSLQNCEREIPIVYKPNSVSCSVIPRLRYTLWYIQTPPPKSRGPPTTRKRRGGQDVPIYFPFKRKEESL